VPLNVADSPELVADPENVTDPDVLPEACGLKIRSNETLLPDGMVTGNDRPLTENSEPLRLAESIVTGPLLADREAVWVLLVPTTTLPKFTDAGVTPTSPGLVAVPDSAIGTVELEALESMSKVPVWVPAEEGAKLTLNVADWPGLNVTGGVIPLKPKPAPVATI